MLFQNSNCEKIKPLYSLHFHTIRLISGAVFTSNYLHRLLVFIGWQWRYSVYSSIRRQVGGTQCLQFSVVILR